MMFTNFKNIYKLIAVDLSKQKSLDADPKAFQQFVFQGVSVQKLRLYTVLEKWKETLFKFDEGTTNVLKIPYIKIK